MANFLYSPEYHRIADFLGVDADKRTNSRIANKISLIAEWAKNSSQSLEFTDVVKSLKKLRNELGVNTKGETFVKQAYQYIRIKQDTKRLEMKREVDKERESKKEKEKEQAAARGKRVVEDYNKHKVNTELSSVRSTLSAMEQARKQINEMIKPKNNIPLTVVEDRKVVRTA